MDKPEELSKFDKWAISLITGKGSTYTFCAALVLLVVVIVVQAWKAVG
jgi:hypothetical protein